MKKNILIIFVFVIFFSSNNFCLSKQNESGFSHTISNDYSDFINDFLYLGNEITNFDLNDILCVGGITSSTALLFMTDQPIRKKVRNFRNNKTDNFFQYPNEMGGNYSVGFPLFFYFGGLILKNEDLRTTGRLMAEAFLLSGVVAQSLKIGFGRARPFLNKGNTFFRPFSFQDHYYSLPSGHSTVIFSLATVFAFKYNKWWSYAIGYSLATSTALARVYYDKHWTSDIFLGSAIGIVSGLAIINAYKHNLIFEKQNLKISFLPSGIYLNYKF